LIYINKPLSYKTNQQFIHTTNENQTTKMTSQMGYIPKDIKSTNNGLQTTASSDVLYASPSGFHQVVAPTDAVAITLTPQQLMGGFINQATTVGATAMTLPTAEDLVEYMNGASVYSSVRFTVRNIAAGNTITMTASTGITVSGTGTLATAKSGEYLIVFSDVSPGTETAICYVISTDNTH
jgi:hypothetical protein